MKFRRGDVVQVTGEVTAESFDFDGSERIKVRIEPYHDIYVSASEVSIGKPAFRVGDRVTWDSQNVSHTGDVLAIAEDHLWVSLGDGVYVTVCTGKAMRADPELDAEASDDAVIVMKHENIAGAA